MAERRRKIYMLFILFGVFWTASSAQGFGIKMFYNFAKNSWVNPGGSLFREEYASKYALGACFEFRFIPYISLSVEGLLSQKGGIIASPGEKGIEYQLTYVSVPLLLNWYIFPVGTVQLFVSGGAEYSFLLEGKAFDLDLDREADNNLGGKLAKSDLSYLVGLGVQANIIITKMILEGRYSVGQKDIFLPNFLAAGESFKNRVISFGVGFKF